jgi:hypothetical protein
LIVAILDDTELALENLHALLLTFRSTTSLIVRGVEITKVFRERLVADCKDAGIISANCRSPELVSLNPPRIGRSRAGPRRALAQVRAA